ncbi:MAG: amino acid ABC transporter permease [Alphaproteobacteria bacterium]|jgi:general L-amino acid transport system permease protein|nr:amino acid ABC transporter permease [Alphaproteobacteria bacterium]MBT4085247.1 amino acid ABC transporter permease [Alphaproteobacteria bacterium]MBT4544963.1 amino acid ABC transporter permease [Alphaproteobacteria bacterium]MBT7746180.1 amino acid ABC transporter permease [Alphaproteobacteria bacterium]
MIDKRFDLFMYGFYKAEDHWRPNLAIIVFIIAMLPVLFDKLPGRRMCAMFLILGYPAFTVALIRGPIEMSSFNSTMGIALWVVAFVAAAYWGHHNAKKFNAVQSGIGYAIAYIILFIVFIAWGMGLTPTETDTYGGLMLTVMLAGVGIAVALPLGILLALGRRANSMPIVQMLCIGFIEIVRSVPLISVLFMAQFMLPLFMPEGIKFDNVMRALVGFSLFAAAYMAEVVRGGLQAIPKGQFEAADSLGLNFYLNMRLIVLPQALKIVIPGIVSTFIGLFKDTSLVSIIALADLLLVAKQSYTDSNWLGLEHTAYVFIAIIYFCICFSMSRYSMYLEQKLHTGHKR